MIYSGIPVQKEFRPSTLKEQKTAKSDLGFATDKPLVLVTGGGTGAHELNKATLAVVEKAFTSQVASCSDHR